MDTQRMNDPWLDQFKQQVLAKYPNTAFTFTTQIHYQAVGSEMTILYLDGDGGWSACTNTQIGRGDTLDDAIENLQSIPLEGGFR